MITRPALPTSLKLTWLSLRLYGTRVFWRGNPTSWTVLLFFAVSLMNSITAHKGAHDALRQFSLFMLFLQAAFFTHFQSQTKSPQAASIPGLYRAEAQAAATLSLGSISLLTLWVHLLGFPLHAAFLFTTIQCQIFIFQWLTSKNYKHKKLNIFFGILTVLLYIGQLIFSILSTDEGFIFHQPPIIAIPLSLVLTTILTLSILSAPRRATQIPAPAEKHLSGKTPKHQKKRLIPNEQLKNSLLTTRYIPLWATLLINLCLIPAGSLAMASVTAFTSSTSFHHAWSQSLMGLLIISLFPQSFLSIRTHWAPLFVTGYFGTRQNFVRTLFQCRLKHTLLSIIPRTGSLIVCWACTTPHTSLGQSAFFWCCLTLLGVSLGFTEALPFLFTSRPTKQAFMLSSIAITILAASLGNPMTLPLRLALTVTAVTCGLGLISYFITPKRIITADWPYEAP